ncbi:beta-galactosidase [Fibrella aquatica]|uniref:beta-galactosidase n=1 Tax=Fibrella aquatica TaxID=3242487 RepID=UPI0035224D32
MNRFYRVVLTVLLGALTLCVSAQDKQRYLAISLNNNYIGNGDDGIESINQLKALGGNTVLVTVLWSTVNNWRKNDPNPWLQYDNQIAAARRNGMKVAIRIWIDNQRPDVPSDPNNNMEDGFNGWAAGDRMQGYNIFGQNLRVYQQFDGLYLNQGTFRVFTSFAAPATVEKGTTFAARVAERYRYLLDTNELLFICMGNIGGEFSYPLVTTKGLEGDFIRLYDYSEPMVKGYRNWLKSKYGGVLSRLKEAWKGEAQNVSSFDQIQPKTPNGQFKGAFEGESGLDWYRYRHGVMKTFMYEVTAAIKATDNRFPVIHEYGSVYDKLSVQRGTFSFKDTGESLDGIKINDGQYSDYRFSTDIARSNSPGKLIVNEVEGNINRQNNPVARDEMIRQFIDCYEHGTQVITTFNFDLSFEHDRSVIREIAARYIANTAPVIRSPKSDASYTISGILNAEGCNANRSSFALDCQAYKDWRTAYDLSGGQPVNFLAKDDILSPNSTEVFRYNRVLVIGNAMTEKAPDNAIGWTGGPWGMAATSREKDYVSLLTDKLVEQNPDVSVQRLVLNDWERSYVNQTFPYKTAITDRVAALWAGEKPDLVIVSLGENISQAAFDPGTLRAELIKLVVATGFAGGTVVLRNSFLNGQNQSNQAIRNLAEETGWRFVNLNCIRAEPLLNASTDWPAADSLVKRYPGDAGMTTIANLYCNQIPGLNCSGEQVQLPVVTRVRVHFGVDSCSTCSDRCRSGFIQGSQDSLSWTTLAILRQPAKAWNEYVVNADQPWRYVRYVAAKDCRGELTELEFYAGNRKLKGIAFGSGASQPTTGYQAALDGQLTTTWKGATPGPQNTVGLDFGVPTFAPELIEWCPDEVPGTVQLELAPNPADDYITYLYHMPTADAVTIEVFNVAGRLLERKQLAGSETNQQYRIYTGNWPQGVYVARIKAGTFATSKRFLIVR